MTRRQINPPAVFRSQDHGFPQAVATTGRTTLYVSGQVAWDAEGRLVGRRDLAAQATKAFSNLRAVVEAGGASLSDVVSLRIYVVDYTPASAVAVGGAFRESFPADAAPATTWVGVAALADPDFLIEVEATAAFD